MNLPNVTKGTETRGGKSTGNSTIGKSGRAGGKSNKGPTTDFDVKNPYHMVQRIDLSSYRHREFSRAAFREFIESIGDMRCLSTLILKNNGIDDNYLNELELILGNSRITRLNLSQNDIGKKGVQLIARLLKESTHH
jgi:hypothetical protein